MEIKTIGVIGAGTMGISVTYDLLLHERQVVLVDQTEDALDKAKNEILNLIRFTPLNFPDVSKTVIESMEKKVKYSLNLNDVMDCHLIIENVPERIDVKESVYHELDNICQPSVCFCANTSCISITQLASFTSRPDKVIGMHLMNPVYKKPVAEIIRGFHTSQNSIDRVNDFLCSIGKEMILVEDFPGFVSNRISHLFMNEAAFVVQDGVASAKDVDAIFKKCFGHIMGPLETADIIGLDTVVDSLDILYSSYQDAKYRCCPLLRKMVLAGQLGKKTKKGFYKYP